MTQPQLDPARAEAFAGSMVNLLNNSCLGLMTAIGHRTGLFDTLAELPESTSAQIAEAANLQERYVREWLSAMAAGKVVEYDGTRRTFRLPPEHAASLTRAAGPGNLAMMTQYIGLLGKVETAVADCFRTGGGVPYSAFEEFQSLQAEESTMLLDAILVDTVIALAPGLTERLHEGAEVVDVGCGQGHAVNVLAKAFPNSNFAGFDFSPGAVAAGRAEAEALGLTNARFEAVDVAKLEDIGRFDLITAIDTIHDQADPARVLKNIHNALAPGGHFVCIDILSSTNLADNLDHPLGPMLYTASTMHCMTVSLAQCGAGLGTCWGTERALTMMRTAGFADAKLHTLEGDVFHAFYTATKR